MINLCTKWKNLSNSSSWFLVLVTQWVVVTHIESPNHFYVSYMAERVDSEILSRRINNYCCIESCHFTDCDSVETGKNVLQKKFVVCKIVFFFPLNNTNHVPHTNHPLWEDWSA